MPTKRRSSEFDTNEGATTQPEAQIQQSEVSGGDSHDSKTAETAFVDAGHEKGASEMPSNGQSRDFSNIPPIDSEEGPHGYYGVDYSLDEDGSDKIFDFDAEFPGEFANLPHPDVFNAYPPEIQRKIMEWIDRDVRARRDDESRRRDEIMRAEVERTRRSQMLPAIIVVLALVCGVVSGVWTGNPLFAIAFLIVPLAVIGALLAGGARKNSSREKYLKKSNAQQKK